MIYARVAYDITRQS